MAETKEHASFGVLVHAIIAGVVAVTLVSFEWISHWLATTSVWLRFSTLAVVFLLVFSLVYRFATYLERMQRRLNAALSIDVRNAGGSVDGYWVDAVFQAGTEKLVGGSIIKIASAAATGFRIDGWTYDPDVTEQIGHFIGFGSGDVSGIVYKYAGLEGRTTGDQGIGHYDFQINPADATEITFAGMFMGLGLENPRHVRGRRIREFERNKFGADNGKTVLREFLEPWRKKEPHDTQTPTNPKVT